MNTSLFGYFRHQFVASPLRRFLWIVPLIVLVSIGVVIVDSAVVAAFLPSLVTPLVLVALQEEETAYTAFGLPRSRAVKLTAFAVVPAVVVGIAVSLIAQPNWVGLLGSLLAVVNGLLLGSRYIDATVEVDRSAARRRIGRGGFAFETIFKPQLLWAAGIAVAHCLLLYLASVIGNQAVAQFFAGLPILVWAMAYCSHGTGILGAMSMTGFGVPRRCWLTLYWGAALASVALYTLVLVLVAPPGVSQWGALVSGAAAFASAMLGAALKLWRADVGLFPAMFLFFAVRDSLLSDDLIPVLLVVGAVLPIGLVLQALFVAGVINPKPVYKDA